TGATIQIATCAVHQRRQRRSTRSRGGRRPSPVCAAVMRWGPGVRGGRGSRLHPMCRHGRPETPRPGRAARPEGRLTQVAREAGLRNRLFDGEAARTVRRLGHEPGATLPSERGGPAPRRPAARARGGDGGLLPPGDRSRARAGRDRAHRRQPGAGGALGHARAGVARGWAELDGERWEFDGADVYGEKNWGREGFPGSWWWGQAHGFADPGAVV